MPKLDLVHRRNTNDYKKFKNRMNKYAWSDSMQEKDMSYAERDCKDMIMSILANDGDFSMSYNEAWDLIMNNKYMQEIINEIGFDTVSDIADPMILNFVDNPDVAPNGGWISESYDRSEEIARKYFYSLNKEKERGYTRYFVLNDGYFVKDIIADTDREAIHQFNELTSRTKRESKSAVITNNSENIKVDGYRGTWYVIDSAIYNGRKYFLLEHEYYGDETCGLIVDSRGNFVAETYDDIITGLEDHFA